jgi:single-stranded-DNA-specific exonuclease
MSSGGKFERKWKISPVIPGEISQSLGDYPLPLRQVLYNRGYFTIDSARAYLDADAPIYSPFLLSGMDRTVDRLADAIKQGEKIVVYGDYDVDGVSATVLLVEVIRKLEGSVDKYIPDRFDEGYGLNCEALEILAASEIKLVITVDCGIRSPVEAARASELGMDLIISDHHHPRGEVPAAFAVVCPKQEGDPYPNKEISGVGLAYKIADALISKFPGKGITSTDWLDLVALGTVADVVPLTGENRILVRKGLEVIRTGNRLGLRVLANIAGIDIQKVNSTDIGFKLGPRLNASGRLDTAESAYRLLISTKTSEAGEEAKQLDTLNYQRQKLTAESVIKAGEQLVQSASGTILFAADETFSEGIVGLIASKLTEAHYRPSIAGTIQEETIRASCRSIREFHITQALDECADLLVRHGGHAMAAGFTIRRENLDSFLERLFSIAERELGGVELVPSLHIDAEVSLKTMDWDLLRYLDQLNPTGAENPGAVFIAKGLSVLETFRMGADRKHLRLRVKQDGTTMSAVAFGFGEWAERSLKQIEMVFRLEMNEYNGFRSLQLNVIDLRESTA